MSFQWARSSVSYPNVRIPFHAYLTSYVFIYEERGHLALTFCNGLHHLLCYTREEILVSQSQQSSSIFIYDSYRRPFGRLYVKCISDRLHVNILNHSHIHWLQ